MTDYRPLLARAIANLDPNTGEARRAVYDRARTALVNQLRGLNPPLAEADVTRQRLALEDAIRRVEGEAAAAAAAPQPPRADRPTRPETQQQQRPAPPPRGAPPPHYAEDDYGGEQDRYEPAAEGPREVRPPRGMPRAEGRDQRPPQRSEPSLRPQAGRGRNAAEYAREGARKSSRRKFVVLGLLLLLLLTAAAVGYVNRGRIFTLVSNVVPFGTEQSETASSASRADRVPQAQQNDGSTPLSAPPVGSGRRAVLFEENPGTQQFTAINGTVSWRAETITPGADRPPELMIHADIEVPDRKLTVSFSVRRNPDPTSSASHYIYVRFSGDDSFGGIAQVPIIRMKCNESAQGTPLAAVSHRVMPGLYLFGLSAIEADRERNLTALRTQPWIDIAFVYENGRRSVIAFEKGPAGDKALAEAFAAWGI